MITIKELANILNLAPSTVSMALNDRKGISSDIKIKVKEEAKKYGYLPYINARKTGMYNKNSRVISIVYPKCDIHITETVQQGIDKIIKENDFHKIRYTVDVHNEIRTEKAKEIFIANILEHTTTSGIILFSITLTEIALSRLIKKGIPVVFLNTFLEYGKSVYMNNINAAYKAVNNLIKLGRKKIGLVIPDNTIGVEWKDRFEGYKKALLDNKIKFNPNYVMNENNFSNLKSVGYTTKNLIEENPEINGIFYASDIFAFSGIKMLKDMGKNIPDDIAVIGIDDMPIDEVLEPSLSSVKMPFVKMGEKGAGMLLDAINEKEYLPKSILIDESELILRMSCKKGNNISWI